MLSQNAGVASRGRERYIDDVEIWGTEMWHSDSLQLPVLEVWEAAFNK